MNLNNLVPLALAVVPAFPTARSLPQNADTYWNRLVLVTLGNLLVVLISCATMHAAHLLKIVPWLKNHDYEMQLLHYIILIGGVVVLLEMLFRVVATKVNSHFVRAAFAVFVLTGVIFVVGHVALIDNQFQAVRTP